MLVIWIVLGVLAWLVFALLAGWVWAAPSKHRDLVGRAAYRFAQVYSKVLHRVQVEGRANIPDDAGTGWYGAASPLVVIANHTAGCDPLVAQSALPFEARWIMAADMRVPMLEPIWQFLQIITLDRRSKDATGLRQALAHLKAGGVLGMFPEGHLERPMKHLLPFEPGIAMLIRRGNARVLPVLIDGTPQRMAAWDSLLTPSRTTIRFLPIIPPERWEGMTPAEIADSLRQLYQRETGWPLSDTKPDLEHDPPLFVDFAGQRIDETGQRWEADAAGVQQPTGRKGVLSGDDPQAIRWDRSEQADAAAGLSAHEGVLP